MSSVLKAFFVNYEVLVMVGEMWVWAVTAVVGARISGRGINRNSSRRNISNE